jgi:mono/diheme cytochrome c family protein
MPAYSGLYLGAVLAGLATLACAAPAHAGDGDARAGRKFATQNCRQCHEVGKSPTLSSMLATGPAFRDVANASTTTPLALRVFLTTSHPTMPNIVLSKTEIDDLVAYIMSLRTPAPNRT